MTLNDIYYHYWKDYKSNLIRKNTYATYVTSYENYALNSIGLMKLSEISTGIIKNYYEHLARDVGLKAVTIGTLHNVIHQLFVKAIEHDFLTKNPSTGATADIDKVSEYKGSKRTGLTIEQEKTLLKYVKNNPAFSRLYPVITTMLRTGMRISELCGLQKCDINFENGTIDINHDLVYYRNINDPNKKYRFEIHEPKTEKSYRKIPLLKEAREAIESQLKYQEALGIKCRMEINGYKDFVFLNYYGDPYNYHDLNKSLDRIVKSYNKMVDKTTGDNKQHLPKITSHMFRHSFANRTAECRLPEIYRYYILGHKCPDITNDVYTDVTDKLFNDCTNILQEFISSNFD